MSSFQEPPRNYSHPALHQPFPQRQNRPPPLPPMALLLNTNEPRHDLQRHEYHNHALPSPSHPDQRTSWHNEQQRNASLQHGYQHAHDSRLQYREPYPPAISPTTAIEMSSAVRSEASSRRPSTAHSSRSVPISGLLDAAPSKPPSPRYSIRVRQEPVAARACGFGERDRRVIDPPPILQMHIDSPTSTREEMNAMIRSNYCVVHCTLWDPVTDREDTAMPGTNDKKQQRRLMGTLVSSPFVGLDENSVEGCFFTFPDLSVRTPGRYALRFSLVVLDPTNMRPGGAAPIRSSAMSVPFQVFNAKDFRGMRASSALTKRLKDQGCLISVKKGNAKTHGSGDHDDDEDDEDHGHGHAGDSSAQRKKTKR